MAASVCIAGLQRSGTNYIEWFLKERLGLECLNTFWKHALPSEHLYKSDMPIAQWLARNPDTRVLLVVRHPALWFESVMTRSSAHLFRARSVRRGQAERPKSLAELYSAFNRDWLELGEKGGNVTLCRYEDWLNGNYPPEFTPRHVPDVSEDRSTPDKLPVSPPFTEADKQKNINFVTHLQPADIDGFWQHLDADLCKRLGYAREQVRFEQGPTQARARDLLYRSQKGDPSTVLKQLNLEEINEIIAVFPQEPHVWALRYLAAKDRDRADLAKAISLYKERAERGKLERSQAVFLGRSFLQAGEYPLTREICDLLHEQWPYKASGWKLAADLFAAEGKREEAVQVLREAMLPRSTPGKGRRKKPLRGKRQLVSAQVAASALLRASGSFREAEEAARAAVACDPESDAARHELAVVLHQMLRFSEAEQEANRALELKPGAAGHTGLLRKIRREREQLAKRARNTGI